MKRFLSTVLVVLALLCALPAPAGAHEPFTLLASGSRTNAGTGSSVDVGAWRHLHVFVRVTAGSGTVNPFRVWLEGSHDDSLWQEISCQNVLKAGAAAPGTAAATQRDIVNEVAVVSSATQWSATCEIYTSKIRVAWNIAGSSPSETFAVFAAGK